MAPNLKNMGGILSGTDVVEAYQNLLTRITNSEGYGYDDNLRSSAPSIFMGYKSGLKHSLWFANYEWIDSQSDPKKIVEECRLELKIKIDPSMSVIHRGDHVNFEESCEQLNASIGRLKRIRKNLVSKKYDIKDHDPRDGFVELRYKIKDWKVKNPKAFFGDFVPAKEYVEVMAMKDEERLTEILLDFFPY